MWYKIGFLAIAFLLGAYLGGLANLRLVRRKGGEAVIYLSSRCETCVVPGPWYLRIPLFWYLILRGRCCRCGNHLKVENLVFELVGGIVFTGSLMLYGFTVSTLASLLSTFAILILAILDFRYRMIPQHLVWIGLSAAGIVAILPGGIGLLDALCGGLIAGGVVLLLSKIGFVEITPTEGENFLKMICVAGAFLGLRLGIITFALSASLWGVARVIISLIKNRVEAFPAGVPVLITTALILAYGNMMLELVLAA